MNFDTLKHHKARICDYKECKEFAVLIPIVEYNGTPCILFQVRSGNLIKQPNEICFPGGGIEHDENPLQAAVRETCEELLIDNSSIEVLGELDILVTPFNTVIYPFAAYLKNYKATYSPAEVQEVFCVPIDFLSKHTPQCSHLDVLMQPHSDFPYHKVQYGKDYPWAKGTYPVYFYEYQDKIIWGITARVLKNFIELINE